MGAFWSLFKLRFPILVDKQLVESKSEPEPDTKSESGYEQRDREKNASEKKLGTSTSATLNCKDKIDDVKNTKGEVEQKTCEENVDINVHDIIKKACCASNLRLEQQTKIDSQPILQQNQETSPIRFVSGADSNEVANDESGRKSTRLSICVSPLSLFLGEEMLFRVNPKVGMFRRVEKSKVLDKTNSEMFIVDYDYGKCYWLTQQTIQINVQVAKMGNKKLETPQKLLRFNVAKQSLGCCMTRSNITVFDATTQQLLGSVNRQLFSGEYELLDERNIKIGHMIEASKLSCGTDATLFYNNTECAKISERKGCLCNLCGLSDGSYTLNLSDFQVILPTEFKAICMAAMFLLQIRRDSNSFCQCCTVAFGMGAIFSLL